MVKKTDRLHTRCVKQSLSLIDGNFLSVSADCVSCVQLLLRSACWEVRTRELR